MNESWFFFERFTWGAAVNSSLIYWRKSQCADGIPVGEKVEPVNDWVNKKQAELDFLERHSCVFFLSSQLTL